MTEPDKCTQMQRWLVMKATAHESPLALRAVVGDVITLFVLSLHRCNAELGSPAPGAWLYPCHVTVWL